MSFKLRLWIFGALVSAAIIFACRKTQVPTVETVILLLLEWILGFCIELSFSKSSDVLGDLAPRLRDDEWVLTKIRSLTKHSLDSHALKSDVVNEHLTHVLDSARNRTAELADGTLEVDLLPGGRHLRDFVDLCKHKYQGVSLVNLEEYWEGPAGTESLNKCKRAVKDGKTVERIFIEHRTQLPTLARFVRQQQKEGIRCRVATYEKIDGALRKDFAVIDDGEAVVNLIIDDNRSWTEANYYINREGTSGYSKVREFIEIWEKLVDHSLPADEFLQYYPEIAAQSDAHGNFDQRVSQT